MASTSTDLIVLDNSYDTLKRFIDTTIFAESPEKRVCDSNDTAVIHNNSKKVTWTSFINMENSECPITEWNEEEDDKNDDKGSFSEDKTNEKRPLPEEIRALPIEKQMEYVLEEMDKDVSIHQEFKPPAQVKEVAPEHPISHLVFVYIPQRGCAVCALPTIHA